MLLFVTIAALMIAAALAFVLPPLLRGRVAHVDPSADARRRLDALNAAYKSGILNEAEYAAKRAELGDHLLVGVAAPPTAPRGAYIAAIAVALLLPAAAIVLYRVVGTPVAMEPAAIAAAAQEPPDHGQNIDEAIGNLATKLKQNPNDAEGWVLLGRAYEATQRFAEARDALKHAYDLAKGEPDITVAYAEAQVLASDSHRIEGEPLALIQTALKAAPDNQRGLWLLGISQYQQKKYDAAIATWQRLIGVLPKDSDIIAPVQRQIAQAQAERDGKAPPAEAEASASAATATPPTAPASAAGPHLTIDVALDPKLKEKLSPNDVLFVYAKAASGPPMPLAIQRVAASKLPMTVTLTEGMGMLPNMKLSQFPQVIIGARVSKSGDALPQSGDLQVLSKPLAVTTTTPIKLVISQVVP